jgi:GDP-L-fucose synthase
MREFLYADDLANALVYLMLNYNEKEFVNVGYGDEITIKDLALLIKKIIGFEGHLEFDSSKPNGTPRKLMDSSRLFATGWKPKTDLEEGIALAYQDFLNRNL